PVQLQGPSIPSAYRIGLAQHAGRVQQESCISTFLQDQPCCVTRSLRLMIALVQSMTTESDSAALSTILGRFSANASTVHPAPRAAIRRNSSTNSAIPLPLSALLARRALS